MSAVKVLVTGASRGLGRSIAVAFAAEGAHVIGTGRDLTELEQTAARCHALPGAFVARELDVRDTARVEEVVGEAGLLDVCVANAGISQLHSFLDTNVEDLRRILEVNVVGAFAVMRAAARAMVAAGEGRIVPIASVLAIKGYPEVGAYNASKHALLGLARTMALELQGTGVHVTTVFPGPVRTEILPDVDPAVSRMEPDDVARAIVGVSLMGPSIGSCELHLQPEIML
jgi:NAD(P)-dependent dehydrogenase (short-subunit alcohol dehydrogenase family)